MPVAVEKSFLISTNNPIHFSSNGQSLLNCIDYLHQDYDFKKMLSSVLIDILVATNVFTFLSQIKESIWANFHQSFVLKLNMFCKYQSSYSSPIFNGAILELSENVLKLCLKMRSESVCKQNDENDSLSDRDQQTLMYISGYIILQLKNMQKDIKIMKKYYIL